MLLINGKPVQDTFLKDYAAVKKIDFESLLLEKPQTFKLSDSFFRKVHQREMKTNRLVERVRVSPQYNMEATIDFFNPFTGMRDKLTYATQYIPDSNGKNIAEIEPVSFVYGFLIVEKEQTDLFFWLNNHPLNQNNPKYLDENVRPNKPFAFRQILPDQENATFFDHEMAVAKVVTMLGDSRKVSDKTLKHLAKSYGFGSTLDKGRKDLVAFVLRKAKENPSRILNDLSSAKTEIRSIIADAEIYGIIKQDSPYWKWCDTAKGKRSVNQGIICQVANGLEPMDFFVDWIREKDNSGVFNQLKKELDDKKLEEVEKAEAVTA